MDTSPARSPIETISADLWSILRGVMAVLGTWRLDYPQMLLVSRRFSTTFRGIERLLERFRAGRLRQVQHRTPRRSGTARKAASAALPRKFGWLVQAGGYHAAGFGSQLQTVLGTPEMVALLATSAQAQRMLRPLCRALAVELPWVRGEARKARQTQPRIRKARPKPEPFRIPLPRGVLAAARRQGFGKMC